MKAKIIFLSISCLLSSCIGFDTKDKVVGNYYLVAPDDESQLSLDYCDPGDQNGGCGGVIGSTVFAVGYDKEYIIVKQHPNNARNITNYFILPLKNGAEPTNSELIGPLTSEQFSDKKKELKVSPDIKFTIENARLK